MPFATEEMWRYLPVDGEALIVADWPQADESYIDDDTEAEMAVLMDMVRGVRDIRTQYNVQPGDKLKAYIAPGSYRDNVNQYGYIFGRLVNVPEIELLEPGTSAPEKAATTVVSDASIFIPLAEMIDFEAECARLQAERDSLAEQIKKTQGMLANENFVNKARPDVVQRERDRLTELQASAEQNASRIAELCENGG
jgi:valyl-tRNA synthetase